MSHIPHCTIQDKTETNVHMGQVHCGNCDTGILLTPTPQSTAMGARYGMSIASGRFVLFWKYCFETDFTELIKIYYIVRRCSSLKKLLWTADGNASYSSIESSLMTYHIQFRTNKTWHPIGGYIFKCFPKLRNVCSFLQILFTFIHVSIYIRLSFSISLMQVSCRAGDKTLWKPLMTNFTYFPIAIYIRRSLNEYMRFTTHSWIPCKKEVNNVSLPTVYIYHFYHMSRVIMNHFNKHPIISLQQCDMHSTFLHIPAEIKHLFIFYSNLHFAFFTILLQLELWSVYRNLNGVSTLFVAVRIADRLTRPLMNDIGIS